VSFDDLKSSFKQLFKYACNYIDLDYILANVITEYSMPIYETFRPTPGSFK